MGSASGTSEDSIPAAFGQGRIISPGTPRQLGVFGLFPPASTQRRVLEPLNQPLTAKSAEPDLLWIEFAELCGGSASPEDYRALAAEHPVWVIDDVPSPAVESLIGSTQAWRRFGEVVDVLHDQDITLFLVGHGPFDWDAAATHTQRASIEGLDMGRIAGRLSLLAHVESEEDLPDAESAGC
jgi:cell division protein ZapE